jgi:hypothetical protein
VPGPIIWDSLPWGAGGAEEEDAIGLEGAADGDEEGFGHGEVGAVGGGHSVKRWVLAAAEMSGGGVDEFARAPRP